MAVSMLLVYYLIFEGAYRSQDVLLYPRESSPSDKTIIPELTPAFHDLPYVTIILILIDPFISSSHIAAVERRVWMRVQDKEGGGWSAGER